MKKNIKTYRYLANVFINHIEAYENGKISLNVLLYSLYTKWYYFDNPYKTRKLIKEIIRLIGEQSFNMYQYDLYLAINNKSNKFIEEHKKYLTKMNKPVY